jgi:DNA-binding NtrC family response regulator
MPIEHEITTRARRVLIVEDEPRLRDMLKRAVGGMEFDATSAPNADAALTLLDQREFDIVITDLRMPGLPGIELCDRIRKRWPTTQLIILTGFGDLQTASTAIRLDVVDFLTKPCSLGELETSLNRAMRRRLNFILPREMSDAEHEPTDALNASELDQPRTLFELERTHVMDALERHHGNRAAAAEELGISVRTLYYRLNDYQRLGYDVQRKAGT